MIRYAVFFFINVVTLLLFAFNTPLIAQKVRIGVISDLHYSHPSLIVERGGKLWMTISTETGK